MHALLEHSNRGKRSLGLDLTSDDGLDILYKLAATSDVFLTNKLPSVRAKLRIDVDEIRAANPNIIYVRGTGQGERGPDADKGSYDSLAFWARAGVAIGAKRPEYDLVPVPPAPGFGDSHRRHDDRRRDHGRAVPPRAHRRGDHRRRLAARRRACGPWARPWPCRSCSNQPWAPPPNEAVGTQPAVAQLPDEGRPRRHAHLPAGRQVLAAAVRGHRPARAGHRPALRRPRVADGQQPRGGRDPHRGLRAGHARRVARRGSSRSSASGPSCRTRSKPPSIRRPSPTATCRTARPRAARRSSWWPRRCSTTSSPRRPSRAPEFNEHGDEILAELGLDWDAIVDLKVRGVVA